MIGIYSSLPLLPDNMKRLALFASGAGSNAKNIIEYFRDHQNMEVGLIVTNRSKAGVIDIAQQNHLPVHIISKQDSSAHLIDTLKSHRIDWIILAGYLLKISPELIDQFSQRIINIHPALLPKYGGKGMYGHFVHEAVHAHGEKESGITIHFVNEHYDEGQIIHQEITALSTEETPETIEQKVRRLEIEHYPRVIEGVIMAS
jgi:phosphoribosylglycinamide formyltransferase 1